ncbi:MAG TPA: precorrin-6y C5,15-methyltransferase (decarboxylating) subunit CbiE [Thermodesulfobacteriaceae bacterium]|nr:precorrin-6y C5,15-methyltransferase (decarboxylating) subunit CbiE [Thermodesulfobacteriaceae bacterium]
MFRLLVVGMAGQCLSAPQKELLSSCRLVVGGRRFLALADDIGVETLNITPLAKAVPAIKKALRKGNVGVLASGDPLFFGIGRRLVDEFSAEQVEFHPALSSLQLAMAGFRVPWEDAGIVSLHGRTSEHVPGLLLARSKTIVLTDAKNSPDVLAGKLIEYLELIEANHLLEKCRVMVAENLGMESERFFAGSLKQAADRSFSDLNVLCLLRPRESVQERLGLTESEIAHSRGLITKDEIRAVALHCLRLPASGVFWDVGAGSGSVSIEAARLNPGLTVYAVERKAEELTNIKTNIRDHGCYNVVPVEGTAPDVLGGLPAPQRVFIGGNGGLLAGIIDEAAKRLSGGGLLVANAVTEKTAVDAPELMAGAGLLPRISVINVTRIGQEEPAVLNQISIITGTR